MFSSGFGIGSRGHTSSNWWGVKAGPYHWFGGGVWEVCGIPVRVSPVLQALDPPESGQLQQNEAGLSIDCVVNGVCVK